MAVQEHSDRANSEGLKRFAKGALPLAIVCLFLWGLMKEPSPKGISIFGVFAACGIVLWFGWSSIQNNVATKWLAVPLIVFVGLFLALFVFALALGAAVYLGAAVLVALPYLVYDLLFRAPLQGRADREREEGQNSTSSN